MDLSNGVSSQYQCKPEWAEYRFNCRGGRAVNLCSVDIILLRISKGVWFGSLCRDDFFPFWLAHVDQVRLERGDTQSQKVSISGTCS